MRQLRTTIAYWRQAQDYAAASDDANRLHHQRRRHVSATHGGMGRIDGDAHPQAHTTIRTALQAADPGATDPADTRTPPQRRLDALVEIRRHHLDTAATPTTGGERPHLGVPVDLDTLQARAGRRGELDHSGAIHPETPRRLACDASISRTVTDGASQPLDAGRRTPTIPAALRRAHAARHRGSTAPGRDTPPWLYDAHHIHHWADGGPTNLANLTLLCRRHHRLHHEGHLPLQAPTQRRPPAAA